MKKTFLTIVITLSLLICSCGRQEQTKQTKLNQMELMEQFIGSWKVEESKDTTFFWEAKSYGIGLEGSYKTMTNGKTVSEGKFLQGYDKSTDKCIYVELSLTGDIELNATWFISSTKYKYLPFSDISNFEKASYKIEGEFKSPDMFVETTLRNNIITQIETYIRIK